MKAKFLALTALVLGLASCQQEPELINPIGGEVDVVLTVDAQQLATRAAEDDGIAGLNSAYGAIDYLQASDATMNNKVDWEEVDLRYTMEVYDVNGGVVGDRVKDRMTQIVDEYEPVSFELRLVPGREYRFVVFADFVNQAGMVGDIEIFHKLGDTLEDITIASSGINAECSDAYFQFVDKVVNDATPLNMTLTRPYGKLRVVATDLAELNLNVDPKAVVVTYSYAHPTEFNAVTGEFTTVNTEKTTSLAILHGTKDDMTNHLYTEGYDSWVDPATNRHTHMTLFTDYIPATDQQSTFQFTMDVYQDMARTNLIKSTTFNTEIPVQRNNLTTIVGNVLTTATEVNVTIDDQFAGEETITEDGTSKVFYVSNLEELQAALDAAIVGDNTILFTADIAGQATANQAANKNITIDGAGFKFDGTFFINGHARYQGEETLTFTNIKFETSTVDYFIDSNETTATGRYAHNVTVENCTFSGTANTAVARFRQAFDIAFVDSEGENIHSLAQMYGCNGVIVDGVKLTATGRGISLGTSTNCQISNVKFDVEKYGVRIDGSKNGVTIANSEIKAFIPVIARKVTGSNTVAVTLEGTNTLVRGGLYDIAVCSNEYEDGVAAVEPTADYTLSGIAGFEVFPAILVVNNADELNNALASGEKLISLAAGTYVIPTAAQGKTVTFIGSGNPADTKVAVTKVGTGGENCDYGLDGSTVTFENLTITTNSSTYIGYARCNGTYRNCIINGTYTLYGNSVFEDCTFNVSGDVYNIWTWGAPTATFTRCTFNCDGKAMLLYGTANTKLTMNNCTFNDNGGLPDLKAAIEIGNDYNKSYELVVNQATVNGFEINDKGINTGTTLWANKNSMGQDKLNVVVDGVDVY